MPTTCRSRRRGLLLRAAVLVLLCTAAAASAGEALRRSLNQDDMVLISNFNLEYNLCLRDKASAQLDQGKNVTRSLQDAVSACTSVIAELAREFDQRRLDPVFYQGVIRHLKSDAIRHQLLSLMSRKATGGSNKQDQQ